jgi:hypothetical protein
VQPALHAADELPGQSQQLHDWHGHAQQEQQQPSQHAEESLQLMQQQHQQQGKAPLQGDTAQPESALDQQLQQQQQQQQQQPQVSWAAALQHPREFFLRISHLQPAPAAEESWHSALQDGQQALEQPTGQQQQQQQQPKHWWQGRPSFVPRQSSTALSTEQQGSSSDSSSSSRWASRRLRLLQLLDSPTASWVLIVMSLFVIFQEDFKYAVLPPTADLWFESITLALLITFLVEISE